MDIHGNKNREITLDQEDNQERQQLENLMYQYEESLKQLTQTQAKYAKSARLVDYLKDYIRTMEKESVQIALKVQKLENELEQTRTLEPLYVKAVEQNRRLEAVLGDSVFLAKILIARLLIRMRWPFGKIR